MLRDAKRNQIAAPKVYRPQPTPRVLQKKSFQQLPVAPAERRPLAPPVYRPESKKILQPKAATPQKPHVPNVPVRGLPAVTVQLMRRAQPLTAYSAIAVTPPKVKKLKDGIEQYSGTTGATRTGKLVVLFGEATFDFAVQYAQRHPTYKIVATEYRSSSQLVVQEADAAMRILTNIAKLKNNGVVVLFGVDATDKTHWQFIKEKFGAGQEIEKVQWNDPHTSTYGDLKPETELMTGFFGAAGSSLTAGAKLKMTYAGWPYLPSATKEGQVDLAAIPGTSFTGGAQGPVKPDKYDFKPQRTVGGDIGAVTYDKLTKQTFVKK